MILGRRGSWILPHLLFAPIYLPSSSCGTFRSWAWRWIYYLHRHNPTAIIMIFFVQISRLATMLLVGVPVHWDVRWCRFHRVETSLSILILVAPAGYYDILLSTSCLITPGSWIAVASSSPSFCAVVVKSEVTGVVFCFLWLAEKGGAFGSAVTSSSSSFGWSWS